MSDKKLATFDDDCFDRKDFAENLFNLIKGQKGYQSRVISIKADFSYGKTFFAEAFKNMIDELQDNTNPCLYCHYINIWKEDYNHNPLLALLSSLDEFVGNNNFYKTTTKDNFKNKLKGAVKTLSVELLKEGASHIPMIGKATVKSIETVVNYKDTSIFKDLNALKKVAGMIERAFAEFKKTGKMIIIIDEIDRCHPEYAIEFLETLKHFFDLENLYFILMMNENHLREKVKSKFGYIDFDMWKDKFINLEFELPNVRSQEKFIEYLVYQKYKIKTNHSFDSNAKLQIKDIDPRECPVETLYGDHRLNFARYLSLFFNSLDYRFNNRQIDSICLHLSIALNVLGNKPIYPLVLVGYITKNYIENLPLHRETTQEELRHFWDYKGYSSLSHKYLYDHLLCETLSIQSSQSEIFDNIRAAQFASQVSKV